MVINPGPDVIQPGDTVRQAGRPNDTFQVMRLERRYRQEGAVIYRPGEYLRWVPLTNLEKVR